jgi:hypothetical protein
LRLSATGRNLATGLLCRVMVTGSPRSEAETSDGNRFFASAMLQYAIAFLHQSWPWT